MCYRLNNDKKIYEEDKQRDISEKVVSAVNDYRNGNFSSLRQAVEAYGLKKSTLHYLLKQIENKRDNNIQNVELNLEENPNQVQPNQVENLNQEVENRQVGEPNLDENQQNVDLLNDNGDIPEENVDDQPLNLITVVPK